MAVRRTDSNYDEVVADIASELTALMGLDEKQRTAIGRAAMDTAARADWSNFIQYYLKAYQIALSNNNKRK